MKIFRISQTVNRGWDTYSDAVVFAKTPEEARMIHPDSRSEYCDPWPPQTEDERDWRRKDWADTPDQVCVQYLGEADDFLASDFKNGIICASFHAG